MPRIDHTLDFDDDSSDENTLRIKPQKPRNPHVKDLFDGKFPPKRHKDKRRSASRFDKRNIESL
jgi:hypothetical protein